MLKAHNTQLVKQVSFLQELSTKQSSLMADCNLVLSEAVSAAADEESQRRCKQLMTKMKALAASKPKLQVPAFATDN